MSGLEAPKEKGIHRLNARRLVLNRAELAVPRDIIQPSPTTLSGPVMMVETLYR